MSCAVSEANQKSRIIQENVRDLNFIAGMLAAARIAEESCLDIGCTAIEAEGVVRRTRDLIAAEIREQILA